MSEHLQLLENSEAKISASFAQADSIIMRKYMPEICHYPIKAVSSEIQNTNINSVLRINKIEKIVYDTEENNLDKLLNVYNSVALCGGTIIHIILSDGEKVEYYLGTRSNDINEISICQSALWGTFEGNFPGSKLKQQDKGELLECLNKIFVSNEREQSKIVSVVSGIPGLKSEDSKNFVQGIEKLIDSMKGKQYAMITIAEPVSDEQLVLLKDNYEEIYSQLSPFAKVTQTYSESDSNALAENISVAITESVGSSISNTTNQSRTLSSGTNNTKGTNLVFWSKNTGSNTGESNQTGFSYTDSQNSSTGKTQTKGSVDTFTTTTGQTLQLVQDNKRVIDLLQNIEKQIERIEDAKDTGLWNTATYCLADDVQTSKTLAGTLQSLCRGKKSTIEKYSINTWTDMYKRKEIEAYLKKMIHPVFEMGTNHKTIDVSASSMLSGSELVITAGLPQKSVTGISVSKMVSFSRNITIEDEDYEVGQQMKLGHVYHMGKTEKANVGLDMESLTAHTLITGSTGSGKSNTVYQIIQEAKAKGLKFLVIEPAKGEYKNVFGNDEGVNVYGTNKKMTELLRINPFSFPDDVHVLEHIDRLVEIFNVCWPMYAAMPAILKDAILQSYQLCGWDLENSENMLKIKCFPTFKDVQIQIRNVLLSSDYSEDNKGDYTGALVTRIHSLTNGINGQMFSSDEIDSEKLFDENTIIDLSRVGSQETKALIMGILVMKLNEYRMACASGMMNQNLKHITVLEEAHNLLRNTRGKISAEGGSVAEKSVEMISNSIAEMRTFGEAFVIVDQSPSAIDISAIRNTNTKIIMRLPEEQDRQQAGKSVGLADNQIPELSKLPKGVAVVYQNNWLEAVLCKISKAAVEETPFVYRQNESRLKTSEIRKMIAMLLVGNRVDESVDIFTDYIRENIDSINLSTENKMVILDVVEKLEIDRNPSVFSNDSFAKLSQVVCDVVNYQSFKNMIVNLEDAKDIQEQVHTHLLSIIGEVSLELELAITQCIMRSVVTENHEKVEVYSKWKNYALEERKKVI